MKLVLKIGGVALENQETLQACVKAIKSLAEDGHQEDSQVLAFGETRTLRRNESYGPEKFSACGAMRAGVRWCVRESRMMDGLRINW